MKCRHSTVNLKKDGTAICKDCGKDVSEELKNEIADVKKENLDG